MSTGIEEVGSLRCGPGRMFSAQLDHLLLLCLEGSQVGRKGWSTSLHCIFLVFIPKQILHTFFRLCISPPLSLMWWWRFTRSEDPLCREPCMVLNFTSILTQRTFMTQRYSLYHPHVEQDSSLFISACYLRAISQFYIKINLGVASDTFFRRTIEVILLKVCLCDHPSVTIKAESMIVPWFLF